VTDTDPHRLAGPSPVRRLAGIVLAVLAAVALVGFVAGAWNPWRLVRLHQFMGDPTMGLVVVLGLTLAAFWLLAPVRSEAAQPRRQQIRWLLMLAVVPALLCYGLGHQLFSYEYQQVATSPSGHRHAAFITHGHDRELRIWVGSGLAVRDAGRAGAPCGPRATARFEGEDLLHVSSDYGNFDIRLDPRSARPVNPMGPTCVG
jgi:hypothetical protein